ncbi:MAG: hypothetical protein ACI9CP_000946 [Cryomorphaceae bacterium]
MQGQSQLASHPSPELKDKILVEAHKAEPRTAVGIKKNQVILGVFFLNDPDTADYFREKSFGFIGTYLLIMVTGFTYRSHIF